MLRLNRDHPPRKKHIISLFPNTLLTARRTDLLPPLNRQRIRVQTAPTDPPRLAHLPTLSQELRPPRLLRHIHVVPALGVLIHMDRLDRVARDVYHYRRDRHLGGRA